MKNKKINISVIVVTHNRKEYLRNCLISILEQDYDLFDIVVIDNNSSDGTKEMLDYEFSQIKTIFLDRNLGCPGARNVGVLNSSGEILFFVDDDGLLEHDVLSIVVEEMTKDEFIGAVVCAIKENGQWLIRPRESDSKTRIYMHEFRGQGAIRREVFENVGLYPPEFIYGGEETDLAIRMIAACYRIIFQPTAITHHFRVNFGRTGNQSVQKYFNQLVVVLKYTPPPLVYFWGFYKTTKLIFLSIKDKSIFTMIGYLLKIPNLLFTFLIKKNYSVVNLDIFKIREYLARNSITELDYQFQAKLEYPSLYSFIIKKFRKKLI
jgi:GT2 family glycosyltransferase